MSTIAATVRDITCVEGPMGSMSHATTGDRLTYRLTLNCGTMTAGDTAAVLTCDDKIEAITKKGKAVTLRQAAGGGPGLTPGGTAAYALGASVSGTTVTFSVGGPTSAAAVASGTLVNVYVTVDEA